jgi:hypothetical protein
MLHARVLGFAVLVVISFSQAAMAQSSPYWLTDGYYGKMYKVQNGAVQQVITMSIDDIDYGIAVADTIRTVNHYANYGTGHEYLLNGTPTGNTYVLAGGPTEITDGTTDGVNYNYGISWRTGNVWRFDRNWQNAQSLFSAGYDYGGIAYDTATGTLWLKNRETGVVGNFTTTGTLLSSFNTPEFTGFSLAYERSTSSLWMTGYSTLDTSNPQTILNYSKSGVQLGSLTIAGMIGTDVLGGEMVMIPEPGALVMIGLIGAPMLMRRRTSR